MKLSEVCLNPQSVIGPDGPVTYPCGCCSVCIGKRNSVWRSKLSHALAHCQYPVFITLTYSNEHLPKVYYDESFKFVTDIVHTNGYGESESLFDYFDYKYSIKTTEFNFKDAPHYVSDRIGDTCYYNNDPCFAVCLKKDVQDFIKRLRTNLKRHPVNLYSDVSFSYFICSEYGPKTFRPHYHGILFFRDYNVSQLFINELCESSWSKSDKSANSQSEPIAKAIYNKEGAAAYVSKYITSTADLPYPLRDRLFKPFYLFSKGTPIGSEAFPFDSFHDKISLCSFDDHLKFTDKQSGELVELDVSLPTCSFDRVFPRLLFHRLLDPSTFFKIISRIYQFAGREIPNKTDELNSKFRIGELVNNSDIVDHADQTRFVDYLQCYFTDGYTPVVKAYVEPVKVTPHYLTGDWHKIVYSDVVYHLTSLTNLDLFLFGIPQNRTFCYKIYRLLSDGRPIAATPFLYYYYYNRFYSIQFASQYRHFVEDLNESFNYYGSLCIHYIHDNYSDFFNCLPDDYESICVEEQNRLDRILSYGFSMHIRDLYDDRGKLLLRRTVRHDRIVSESRVLTLQKQHKHKSTRIFNHNKFNDR